MSRAEGYLTPGRFCAIVAASCVVWAGAGLACLFFGQVHIPAGTIADVLRGRGALPMEANIILAQRLPRVALALLAGGGLAVAGAVFQAVLRNPLATPHTLGVSAGGALGAVVAITAGLSVPGPWPVSSVQFFALAGALVNVGVIYLLARRGEGLSPLKLLLAGVTLGLICSALIMFVRFVSDPTKLVMVDRWLMGGLEVQGFHSVACVLPFVLPGLVLLAGEASALNQLVLGEDMAAGRGVNVHSVQLRAFLGGSILTAGIVSVAGPIGFVGLIVPHIMRLLLGPDHRTLLVVSFFGGGVFLVLADTAARCMFPPSELPVGVLTAMLGGPFFLVLLLTRMRTG